MILLFLGSWRSTIIIAISIPLSVFGSVVMLSAIRRNPQHHDARGLALASYSSSMRHGHDREHQLASEHGKEVRPRSWTAPIRIVVPAFVSLLCICIVFVPMFFLKASPASCSSRWRKRDIRDDLVRSSCRGRWCRPWRCICCSPHLHHARMRAPRSRIRSCGSSAARGGFERFRGGYRDLLTLAMQRRPVFVIVFLGFVGASFLLLPYLGQNFFPRRCRQILMHSAHPDRTRLEESAINSPTCRR